MSSSHPLRLQRPDDGSREVDVVDLTDHALQRADLESSYNANVVTSFKATTAPSSQQVPLPMDVSRPVEKGLYLPFAPIPPPQPRKPIGAVSDPTLHGGGYSSMRTIPMIPRALPFNERSPARGSRHIHPAKPARHLSPSFSLNLLTGSGNRPNSLLPPFAAHLQDSEYNHSTCISCEYTKHHCSPRG